VEEKPTSPQQYPQKPDGETSPPDSDAELLRRAYRGDEDAFRTLVDRHSHYLTAVALSMCGKNRADADDLVQETFVGALTSRFRGESAVRTWLVQILVRRAAMLRRSRRREQGKPLPDVEGRKSAPSHTAAADARLDLAQMLESLSPDQRQVIVLRELSGMSYEEMAAALHVPRGTVESRLHRAREALRKLFFKNT
jgi:RNA polymerase sigma-70 factor (ECF subfamily)